MDANVELLLSFDWPGLHAKITPEIESSSTARALKRKIFIERHPSKTPVV
jgi:hypothetical protein